jgi:hypothetical protein
MYNASGHAARLLWTERDRRGSFEVDQELTVEDEEELILIVVLMPVEVSVDHAGSHHRVVDRGERLVELWLARRGLGGDVDQFHMTEHLGVGELDVADPGCRIGLTPRGPLARRLCARCPHPRRLERRPWMPSA